MAKSSRTPRRSRAGSVTVIRPARRRRQDARRLVLVPSGPRGSQARRVVRPAARRRPVAKPRLTLVVSNPSRKPSARTSTAVLRIVRPESPPALPGTSARAFGGARGRSQLVVVLSLLAAGLLTLAASLGQVLAGGLTD